MSSDPEAQPVAAVDEILQILFWLRGEGLADDVASPELVRWLTMKEQDIRPVLERMVELGFVERVLAQPVHGAPAEPRFRLTIIGNKEGGRRFADEFSDMTKPGHGECGDPNCDCSETGDPADCQHLAH